jgi:lysophospholipase L1-like esterase
MARGILHTLGMATDDTAKLEKEWIDSPEILIFGDRQTMAGGRTGGWCHMLLDGLNSGLEMMTYQSIGDYRKEGTLESLAKRLPKIETDHVRFFILQAPRGDALAGTAPADYRNHLETLLAWTREKQMKPILVTIPVQENNPNGELSRKLAPYNDILREVAKTRDIPLADIQRAMTENHAAFPDRLLTYDGERFNHGGAMMMAETLLRAMDLESVLTDKLRKIWRDRPSYLNH